MPEQPIGFSLANPATYSLHYEGRYTCPVCRCGQIAALPLMDAFACGFCRHIFTANLEQQVLKLEDRHPPISWHWNGKGWQGAQVGNLELNWVYWLPAIAFVGLPPMLVWASASIFPPLPGDPLAWFPLFWTGVTFFCHLGIIGWLAIEAYQFPVFAYVRSLGRYWLGSRLGRN